MLLYVIEGGAREVSSNSSPLGTRAADKGGRRHSRGLGLSQPSLSGLSPLIKNGRNAALFCWIKKVMGCIQIKYFARINTITALIIILII